MITPTDDPNNALHRASFYVEELKYGPGEGQVVSIDAEEFDRQIAILFADAGIDSITPVAFREAIDFYGDSMAVVFNMPPLLAKSVFNDGLMHGIALAAGLSGEPRNPKEAE